MKNEELKGYMNNISDVLVDISKAFSIPLESIRVLDDQGQSLAFDEECLEALSIDNKEHNSSDSISNLKDATLYVVHSKEYCPLPDKWNPCDKPKSFGNLFDVIANQRFLIDWRIACLTYPDGYWSEDFEHNVAQHKNLFLFPGGFSKLKTEHFNKEWMIDHRNAHFNIFPTLAHFMIDGKTYYIKQSLPHSVYDSLMFSPCRLSHSNAKQLFILFQLFNAFNYIHMNFPKTKLTNLLWKSVSLNDLLWIQVDVNPLQSPIDDKISAKPIDESKELATCDEAFLKDLVDLWVCGKLSNFDYLMFLNKVGGRKLNDPNNHPILPWVSDLSSEEHSWRDFTKSKYRLNKGDDQLQLQYAMATAAAHCGEHIHVPYHVPDMLSDITFYVYKARVMPKSTLQKHVRSYWEPNEYPLTIQRMQEWTPDECIPEFFTDPSIFISDHPDMFDLGVPEWCESPEDFVHKHRLMLESEYVSQRLHNWIDITFGYKLTGKHAMQSLNVCRQLVDQHVHPISHGIVQLFHSPHPRKRCDSLYSPQKILFPVAKNTTSQFDKEALEMDSLGEPDSMDMSARDEEVAEDACTKIRLPDNFNPLENLEQLEKLLNFKLSETDQCILAPELIAQLEKNIEKLSVVDEVELVADQNMLVLMCMMVELFMLPHANTASEQIPLANRLERAHLCFLKSRKFPQTIKNALEYLFKSLAKPVAQTCEQLQSNANQRIFKPLNHCGQPPPRPWHLLVESMRILHFPTYFHALYDFILLVLKLTNNYEVILEIQRLPLVRKSLLDLLTKVYHTDEGVDLLLLHIIRLLKQSFPHSAYFLVDIFDPIAQVLGPDRCQRVLLPTVINIYTQVNEISHSENMEVVESLYDKPFLIQLINRLGLNTFLDTFPRLFADCMVNNFECAKLASNLEWLIKLVGPTLSSKYIIGNLLAVLKSCYCNKPIDESSSFRNDELIHQCLVYTASLYGCCFITRQYIPHSSYTVSSAISGTGFSEQSFAALVAATELLVSTMSCLTDRTLMEELNRLSKEIILPLIGVVSSKRIRFPQGGAQRRYLCIQTITLLQKISVRIGREMSRTHLTPLLQSFFNNFSIHVPTKEEDQSSNEEKLKTEESAMMIPSSLEPEADSIAAAVRMGDVDQTAQANSVEEESLKSSKKVTRMDGKLSEEMHKELLDTFTPAMAYLAYVPFARLMGGMHMEQILNSDIVWRLSSRVSDSSEEHRASDSNQTGAISMVGNQIVVEQDQNIKPVEYDDAWHLKDNWLAYWGHEIGLPTGDNHIHFNHIDLTAFQGHTSAVKCLHVNSAEDWLLSGSKDKTVKIWSLSGAVCDANSPLYTYRNHKKAVQYVGVVESLFNVVSSDGALHVWDPYTGKQVRVFESSDLKGNITAVSVLPPPHQAILVATSDSMLRMVDIRSKCLAQEYKSTVGSSVGLIRSLCCSATWAAAGFATGVITLLDHRMGPLLRMWQAHDSEVLCAQQVSNSRFITSSIDQTIAYWDAGSHQPVMVYRAIPEAVHILRTYHNEVLSATNSNKFFVHSLPTSSVDSATRTAMDSPIHVTKLRTDTLKGSLTSFAVVPMKRQVVVASESGTLKLLA